MTRLSRGVAPDQRVPRLATKRLSSSRGSFQPATQPTRQEMPSAQQSSPFAEHAQLLVARQPAESRRGGARGARTGRRARGRRRRRRVDRFGARVLEAHATHCRSFRGGCRCTPNPVRARAVNGASVRVPPLGGPKGRLSRNMYPGTLRFITLHCALAGVFASCTLGTTTTVRA